MEELERLHHDHKNNMLDISKFQSFDLCLMHIILTMLCKTDKSSQILNSIYSVCPVAGCKMVHFNVWRAALIVQIDVTTSILLS